MTNNDPFEKALRKMQPVSGKYRFEPRAVPQRQKTHKILRFAGVISVLTASVLLAITFFIETENPPRPIDPQPPIVIVETEIPHPRQWTMRKQTVALLKEMKLDHAGSLPIPKGEYPVIEIIASPKSETKISDEPEKFPNRKQIRNRLNDFCGFDATGFGTL